ncbi:hypothetical protein FACS1894198_3330 [Clostridia bacterium]|nr:hypothetical protein FACS1894198_3330 [Clostridia bacterium]
MKDIVAEIPAELAKKETWDGVFPTNPSEVSTHPVGRALKAARAEWERAFPVSPCVG